MTTSQTGPGSGQLVALTAGSTDLAPAVIPPRRLPMRVGQNATIGMHSGRREDRNSYSVTAFADITDRSLHAAMARFTGGLSPAALAQAYSDWATHLPPHPANACSSRIKRSARRCGSAIMPLRYAAEGAQTRNFASSRCRRIVAFADEAWRQWPFNFIYQGFLLQQQWWHNATTGLRGVSKQHEDMVEFAARQLLDMFAPSNFPLTNPEILKRTISTGGQNLVRGAQNFFEDCGACRRRQTARRHRGTSWSAATSR